MDFMSSDTCEVEAKGIGSTVSGGSLCRDRTRTKHLDYFHSKQSQEPSRTAFWPLSLTGARRLELGVNRGPGLLLFETVVSGF